MIYIVTDLKEIPRTCSGDHPTKKYHYECPFWNDEYDRCDAVYLESVPLMDELNLADYGQTRRAPWCPLRDTNTEVYGLE